MAQYLDGKPRPRNGRELARRARKSRKAENPDGAGIVVGVAVLREGSEVVLFLYGLSASGEAGFGGLFTGRTALAWLSAALLSYVMFVGLVKIPARHLFGVTTTLITFLAAGMAAQSVVFLQQAGLSDRALAQRSGTRPPSSPTTACRAVCCMCCSAMSISLRACRLSSMPASWPGYFSRRGPHLDQGSGKILMLVIARGEMHPIFECEGGMTELRRPSPDPSSPDPSSPGAVQPRASKRSKNHDGAAQDDGDPPEHREFYLDQAFSSARRLHFRRRWPQGAVPSQ